MAAAAAVSPDSRLRTGRRFRHGRMVVVTQGGRRLFVAVSAPASGIDPRACFRTTCGIRFNRLIVVTQSRLGAIIGIIRTRTSCVIAPVAERPFCRACRSHIFKNDHRLAAYRTCPIVVARPQSMNHVHRQKGMTVLTVLNMIMFSDLIAGYACQNQKNCQDL